MSLIDNVLKTCSDKNLTVSELEKQAGLAENSIYRWRDHVPAVNRVQRVAEVLGVTVDELIRRKT